MQLITVEPLDTITQLPVSQSPTSDRTFTSLVLEDLVAASAAFLALQSYTVSGFLWQVNFAEVVGLLVALREEKRLSTATVDASLVAGLLEPIALSFEAVDLVVLFML